LPHCQLSSACPAHARGAAPATKAFPCPRSPLYTKGAPIRETHPTPALPPCSWRRARDRIHGEMFVASEIAERRPLPAQREHWTTGAGGQAVPSSASSTQRPETDADYTVRERPLETRQVGRACALLSASPVRRSTAAACTLEHLILNHPQHIPRPGLSGDHSRAWRDHMQVC
jgi:hypothetical protein